MLPHAMGTRKAGRRSFDLGGSGYMVECERDEQLIVDCALETFRQQGWKCGSCDGGYQWSKGGGLAAGRALDHLHACSHIPEVSIYACLLKQGSLYVYYQQVFAAALRALIENDKQAH